MSLGLGVSPFALRFAADVMHGGGIIAYPTEAVYGLGCDPENEAAVRRLLLLKQRPMDKGMILIAANLDQLRPWLAELSSVEYQKIADTSLGPQTWVAPAAEGVAEWISGGRETIAVRVTAHPVARRLCEVFGGAIVSTSANLTGRPPCRRPIQIRRQFKQQIDYLLHGPLGEANRPSCIRDLITGEIVRA